MSACVTGACRGCRNQNTCERCDDKSNGQSQKTKSLATRGLRSDLIISLMSKLPDLVSSGCIETVAMHTVCFGLAALTQRLAQSDTDA